MVTRIVRMANEPQILTSASNRFDGGVVAIGGPMSKCGAALACLIHEHSRDSLADVV